MPYRQSYGLVGPAGDPFLGGLIKGALKIAKFVPGPIGTIAGAVSGAIGGRRRPQIQAPQIQMPRGRMPTLRGFAPTQLPRGRPGVAAPGVPGRRRRMNYSNQKALRRSLRRVTGYARQQKAVRKAAQEFAREFGPKRRPSRRDLPRGHVHVR